MTLGETADTSAAVEREQYSSNTKLQLQATMIDSVILTQYRRVTERRVAALCISALCGRAIKILTLLIHPVSQLSLYRIGMDCKTNSLLRSTKTTEPEGDII